MPESFLQQKIFPYDGAQDSTKHPLLISPSDVVDSNNTVYTEYSTKKLRPGITPAFTRRPSGNRRILGGVDFWRLGSQRIVSWDGRRIRAVNSAGVEDDITGSITLPTDETISFEKLSGLLIMFFGGGATRPKAWTMTGTIFDLFNDDYYPAFGRVWLNRLWIPDPSVPGRLLGSATNDPTDFVTADATSVDLDINDGDPDGLTAIFPPFFGNLYVAKRLSLYKVSPFTLADGTQIFVYSKISDGVGCISHNAVVATQKNIIFPSDEGIHNFLSTDKISEAESEMLSKEIREVWDDDTNFSRSQRMQAVYDKLLNSYLLIFPTVGRNNPTDLWGYSLSTMKWYRWREYNQTSIFRYIDFVKKKQRTMVCSGDGDFGYIDTSAKRDYDRKISAYIQSGIIAPTGSPDEQWQFKGIAPIFVPQESGSFTITYKLDGQTIETLEFDMASSALGDEVGVDFQLGVSVLGGIPQVKYDMRRIHGTGMLYEFFIEFDPGDSETETGFELLGILFDVDRSVKKLGEVVA